MILTTFGQFGTRGFAEAIVYGADNGAAISSNSWGYTVQNSVGDDELDAIDYFNAYGGGGMMEGGIVVFAAGNDNSGGVWYPGYYGGRSHPDSADYADDLNDPYQVRVQG